MRKTNYILYCIVFTAMHFLSLETQAQTTLKFDRIGTDEGMSQGNVTAVYEDRLGFIWIGTEDGLNLYDGYSIKVYTTNSDDIHSLSNNRIEAIAEDAIGNLWVGTRTGAQIFNRDHKNFDRYIQEENGPKSVDIPSVSELFNDSKGNLWIGTSSGIVRYSPKEGVYYKYYYDPDNKSSLSGSSIEGITEDKQGQIWIATTSGVSKLNTDGQTFENFYYDSESSDNLLAGNEIRSIFCDSKNRLWIGTFRSGLSVVNLNDNSINFYKSNSTDATSISDNFINRITENEKGEIWIGTDNGLNRFNEDKSFSQFLNNPNQLSSLAGNIVMDVIFDRNERMWVGSRFMGLSIYDEHKYGFSLFENSPNDTNSLSSNNTSGFAEDSEGNFYVSTDGEGINYYNRKKGVFTHLKYDPENPNSLTNNKVLAVELDDYGDLWIGMWGGGVNRYNPKTKKFTHYLNDPEDESSLAGNNIFDIFNDRNGNIWIGTWGSGLCKFIKETNSFKTFRPDPNDPSSVPGGSISSMLEDTKGNIWLASGNEGISVLNPYSETFTNYRAGQEEGQLSNDGVLSVFLDRNNRVWVGTNGGGLNILDQTTGKFELITTKEGLPNDGVQTILEDNTGNMWLGTNRGLARFDYDDFVFRTYYKSDGLQGNQFLPRNALKLSTGELLFGGSGGFNLFDPKNLFDNPVEPLVYITDFKLFDKEVNVGENEILKSAITFTDEIVLNYNQNIFSFEYTAINYRHTEKNQYQYILEGFQEDWVEAGTRRSVSFMNLEPGHYTFRVMASNNDGVWVNEPVSIGITVTPPFWATWWFRGIVALILISSGIWLYRWRVNAIKMNQMMLENKVKEATAQVKNQNLVLEAQSESLKLAIQDTNFVLKEALESGNFSARIDTASKEGEWKALGESINLLFESVWKPFDTINNIVNKMAEGDLTERYFDDAKGDILTLSRNLNKAMDNLSELLSEIALQVNVIGSSSQEMLVSSEEMNISTGEIASSIGEMSKGAQEQVVKVDESSNLIDGILRFSSDMGDQAESINQTAEKGVGKSQSGMQQIEKLDTSMKDILNYSDKTNSSIGALTKRSDEISGVVRIIKDIASQTNLLALNAAIEAAQAGDAGRGFAVVAEEIRKLAEDSKKSAGEIEELIAGVQKDTVSTASLITEMSSSIREGEAATKHSLTAFEEISKYYSETLKKSEQILGATKQQTEEIGNVVNIINGVVVIAEETAAGTEETASSSSQLSVGMTNYTEKSKRVSQIADQLKEKVSKFVLRKMEEFVEN